jgi:hypothetical protein
MNSREREERPPNPARKAAKSERLAMALRANLSRRKAQARGRAASDPAKAPVNNKDDR